MDGTSVTILNKEINRSLFFPKVRWSATVRCTFNFYVAVTTGAEGVANLWNVREEWRSARYFEQSPFAFLVSSGNAAWRKSIG